MDNNIEEKLVSGFEQMAPDVFNEIMAAINEPKTDNEPNMTVNNEAKNATCGMKAKKNKLPKHKKRWMALGTVAVLVISILVVGHMTTEAYAGDIYIDVNPSIAMRLDKNNQVDAIEAANDDAKSIVSDITEDAVFPMSAESAVNVVLDELDSKGYLKDSKTDMVISYCYKDETSDDVEQEVQTAAEENLDSSQFVYQCFKEDETVNEEASINNITPGKCYYINSLKESADVTVEECAGKSITDINQAAKKHSSDSTTAKAQTNSTKNDKNTGDTSASQVASKEKSKTAGNKSKSKTGETAQSTATTTASSRNNKKSDKTDIHNGKSHYNKHTGNNKHNSGRNYSSYKNNKSGDGNKVSASSSSTSDTVSVVSTSCSRDGTIRVHFGSRVYFSSSPKVIVTDSKGDIISSSVSSKRSTYIKITTKDLSSNSKYNITIAGVRASQHGNYKSVSTSVTTGTIK